MNSSETQRQDHEIDAILSLFGQSDLSIQEAEHVLASLQPSSTLPRERIVDRLLALLESTEGSLLVPDEETEAGNRVTTQDTALILLTYLGDETLVPRLLALVDRESLSDGFKLKLIGVVHEFAPELDPEDLMQRLHNPYKAMEQSHREHLQRLQSPLELGLWLDVMVNEMLPEARALFARSSGQVDEPLAVPLLICLCYDETPGVALAAMDAVERHKDARALPALEELAERHPDDVVRREAGKVADRLRIRAALAPQVEPSSPPALYLCYLTTIDGTGAQAALLVRETTPGMLRIAQTVFADDVGIEYCVGMDIFAGDLDDLLNEVIDRDMSPVDVSYARFAQAIESACEATWNAGQLLPATFVAWREWLMWEWTHEGHVGRPIGARPEPTDEKKLLSALSTREREQLLHDCPELLFQDEFTSWTFDEDEVGDLGDDFWELVEQGKGREPDVNAVRALLRRVVGQVVTDPVRGLIRDRLRRVAPLLRDLYVDEEVWQWAVVAADALADDSALPPQEHPLLLAMAAHSLENVVGAEVKWRSVGD